VSEAVQTAVAVNKDMARQFLARLDPHATRFTFQFFGDGDDGYAEIFHGSLEDVWPKVQTLNTPGRRVGVFVTINETDFKGRKAVNVVRCRALFVDADSDEQVNHCREILAAYAVEPDIVVRTGRGAHFYFCVEVPCKQFREWQGKLIEKLGTDRAIKDLSRVMRLPGTLHLKTPSAPRLVQLEDSSTSTRCTLVELSAKLGLSDELKPGLIAETHRPAPAFLIDPAKEGKFDTPPAPEFGALADDAGGRLGGGITPSTARLLDPRPIFGKCGFYRKAFASGGAEYGQELWMYSVLGTTFMESGRLYAHEISRGHATYIASDTDAMFDRKMAERSAGGLGYPSCDAIAGAGYTACASCPLFANGKSPLNIRPHATATATDTSSFGQRSGPTNETTVNYVPGNEIACRTALDNAVAADLATFTSGDILTILRVPDQEKPGLERWGGDLPGTTPAQAADVIERAEGLAWMAPTGGKGEQRWARRKPPRDFCTDYITQRRGRYAARSLVGIARVPFIRDDGTIRDEAGYDPETGIFVDRAPKLIVPDFPKLVDAKAALQRVMKPYEYYIFEEPVSGPLQVLAANLTALQRPYMKTAPMFVVNGVVAGTGKGQVCRAIGHLALATTPPFMSWGHDDDEFKKRFDTMLLASPAMLVMDNCNGRLLRGDTLEMILSEGEATIRQFNKLEAITVRSRTFLMANGNNIQISGDMSRRGIKINILPRSSSPESDVFPFTPEDYVMEHRDALLSDYYTIMRAYRHVGMPRSGLPAVGSFSEWERKVRDLIFWLTGHDLSGDFKKNKLDDPEQQEDAALLSALRHFSGERWFKASEIDAALKRATEYRRTALSGAIYVTDGPKTMAAMKKHNAEAVDKLIRAMEDGTAAIDADVLREIMTQRKLAARIKNEANLLEAAEQKFGAKQEYAKTLGNWARGIQKKFVDGLILHRQEDPHTKIHRIKVVLTSSTNE
jgi:hypothetical protein